MKVYRRIEITAFHRRVTISSGPLSGGPSDIALRDNLSDEVIDPQSQEGRRVLTEAVCILQEQLARPKNGELE
jgi:hypothetical protein